jgi:hypothetical protein
MVFNYFYQLDHISKNRRLAPLCAGNGRIIFKICFGPEIRDRLAKLIANVSTKRDPVQAKDAGSQPVPRKIVVTHKELSGSPQWIAYLRDWNFSPRLPDELFVFTPPQGAEKIEFLPVQTIQAPKPRPEKKQKGGK